MLISVLVTGGAFAADLVSNGDFGSNTNDWRQVGRGTMTHDADGAVAAGSLNHDAGLAGNASQAIAGQCISGVPGGQELQFQASVKIVAGSPSYCRVALFESEGDDCLWIELGAEARRAFFGANWNTIVGASHTTSLTTGSVELRLHCAKTTGDTAALEVRWDDVAVTTVGLPTLIFDDDFEGADTTEWTATSP